MSGRFLLSSSSSSSSKMTRHRVLERPLVPFDTQTSTEVIMLAWWFNTEKFVACCCKYKKLICSYPESNCSSFFVLPFSCLFVFFSRRFLYCNLYCNERVYKAGLQSQADEEDSNGSEYSEVRKQLDKTKNKNRSKTLVNVVETQNMLLRRLVLKIEPKAAMKFNDDRSPSLYLEDLLTISPDFLDVQESKDSGTIPKTKAT